MAICEALETPTSWCAGAQVAARSEGFCAASAGSTWELFSLDTTVRKKETDIRVNPKGSYVKHNQMSGPV